MKRPAALWLYVALALSLSCFLLVRDRFYGQQARGAVKAYLTPQKYFQRNRHMLDKLFDSMLEGIVDYGSDTPPAKAPEDRHFLFWRVDSHQGKPDAAIPAFREKYEAALRDYVRNHPDQPEYFWHQWHTEGARRVDYEGNPFFAARPLNDEELTRLRDQRAREPDNGFSYFEEALHEAVWGFTATEDPERGWIYEVADPERAAAAARLLREAVAAPRYTRYAGQIQKDMLRWMGEAETFNDYIRQVSYFAPTPIPNLTLIHSFANVMLHLARERAASPEYGPPAAREIINDLHEWSIRSLTSDNTLIVQMIYISAYWTIVEEGVKILRDAGDEEAAERLLRRTLALLRPYIVQHVYDDLRLYDKNGNDADPDRAASREGHYLLFALIDLDPTLRDEAKAWSREWPGRSASSILKMGGPIFRIAAPNTHQSLLARRPLAALTETAIARERAFEHAGIGRFLVYLCMALTAAAMALHIFGILIAGLRASPAVAPERLQRKKRRRRFAFAFRATILIVLSGVYLYLGEAEKSNARADTLLIQRMDDEFTSLSRCEYLIVKDNMDYLRARIAARDFLE